MKTKIGFVSWLFIVCCFLVFTFFGSSANAGELVYSTYLGGSYGDYGYGIAVDASGNAYVTGQTLSSDFPTTAGAFDTTNDINPDVFVSKLNADGSALLYSTFIGGGGDDCGYSIALDNAGNVYITGDAGSTTFPTTPGAFDTTHNGDYDAFVSKLNADGSALLYSTFIGGGGGDCGCGIALDNAGNAYITGDTWSNLFPTTFPTTPGAFDTTHNGYHDAFVSKLNADGSALLYSTFLGGSDYDDHGYGIAVDNEGNAYITGFTNSGDFPTTPGAFNTDPRSTGAGGAFVSKLNATGSALLYSTFLGGIDYWDCGYGIALDNTGNAYIAGYTESSDFPTTPDAFDTSLNGPYDGFVTKLNPSGTALVYSTYLGGGSYDYGDGIAIDGSGNAYITGYTTSDSFPTTPGAWDTSFNGANDGFMSKLNASGTALVYSTYLGGGGDDEGDDIAIDGSGNAYITGETESSTFPTTPGAFDTSYNGSWDVFVTKLSLVPTITTTYFNNSGSFDFSSDTGNWLLEKYGNGISAGYLSWISTYQCITLTQTPGQKAKLTQVFSVPSTGWYTAKARVLTDISNVTNVPTLHQIFSITYL
jgi:hypothetical protein